MYYKARHMRGEAERSGTVQTNKQFTSSVRSIRQISGLWRGQKREDGKKIQSEREALTWTSFPAHLHSSRREGEGGQDIYRSERERES